MQLTGEMYSTFLSVGNIDKEGLIKKRIGKVGSGMTGNSVAEKKNLNRKKMDLTKGTKFLLDFMFYSGILVTISLPYTLKILGKYLERVAANYIEAVIIYFVLGISAVVLINELRRIFNTVLAEDCFVEANVKSLRRMGNLSFFIALMSLVRFFVYQTMAIAVVILVFVVAGLFSKVLAMVFEEAVRYKEENDLTI